MNARQAKAYKSKVTAIVYTPISNDAKVEMLCNLLNELYELAYKAGERTGYTNAIIASDFYHK